MLAHANGLLFAPNDLSGLGRRKQRCLRHEIAVSLGSDVGLKAGHVMDVFRGTTYLGSIIIRETKPDQAVGQIIEEMQKGQIQQGDNVTTKLS